MDSTNDHVTVDIPRQIDELHEIENELETSPQEYNVIDTTTASQNQSSDEKTVENRTSSPQDEVAAAGNGSTGNGSTEEKDNNGKSPPPQDQANDQSENEDFKKLYKAALKDDWQTAYNEIFKRDPSKNSKYVTVRISEKQDTALHLAVAVESSNFAQELVNFMQKDDLAIKNDDGNTAFFLAAASGMMELAKIMVQKNEDLLGIRGGGDEKMLPIHIAAKHGHEKMVEFLVGETKDITAEDNNKLKDLNHGKDLFAHKAHKETVKTVKCLPDDTKLSEDAYVELLLYLISRADSHSFGFALHLLERQRVTINLPNLKTFLHVLARTPFLSNQNQEGLFKRFFNKSSDRNKLSHEKLPRKALGLLKLLLEKVDCRDDWIHEVVHDAVTHENIEFLSLIICDYPELMFSKVKGGKNIPGLIFSTAILKRQMDIFQLLRNIRRPLRKQLRDYKDDEGNNILHLAGKKPSREQLNNVLGVALQLQQEMFWFKEVRKLVDQMDVEAKNKDNKTPTDILNAKIKDLKDEGEKWMKEIANSCMIVATLITTVAFAAAFTVPGGTKDGTGTPRFIQKVSFIIFVISDTIALASSSCSILIILSIYTTRYTTEEFVVLPRKLVFGLSTLFLSIAAVMVVFCATIFIVFKDGKMWVPTLATVLASTPVIFFTRQLFSSGVTRLFFEKSSLSKHSLFEDDDDDEGSLIKKWNDSACWIFFEECWDSTFFYYFRKCCMFVYYCFCLPFKFCIEGCRCLF